MAFFKKCTPIQIFENLIHRLSKLKICKVFSIYAYGIYSIYDMGCIVWNYFVRTHPEELITFLKLDFQIFSNSNGWNVFNNNNSPQIKKTFKDIWKDPVSDMRKGSGIYCKVTETYLLCPSCQKFVWHKSCLEGICKEFKINVPNLNSAKWKCPNCIWVMI